jgi:hypothetical protein
MTKKCMYHAFINKPKSNNSGCYVLSYKASIGNNNWMQRMSSAEDEELEDMDEVTRKIFLTWVSRMNKTSHQSLV